MPWPSRPARVDARRRVGAHPHRVRRGGVAFELVDELAGGRPFDGDPLAVELDVAVAHADPRSRRPSKRGRAPGRGARRGAGTGQQHAGAEPQPSLRQPAAARQQRGAVAVVVEVVLGQPQRVVAELVGEAGVLENSGRRGRVHAASTTSTAGTTVRRRSASASARPPCLYPVRSDAQDDRSLSMCRRRRAARSSAAPACRCAPSRLAATISATCRELRVVVGIVLVPDAHGDQDGARRS